jgi:hypothetical protein
MRRSWRLVDTRCERLRDGGTGLTLEVLLDDIKSQLVLSSSSSNGDEADESDVNESYGDDASLHEP